MKSCPTRAIRVKDKKAYLINERCIDCGECLRVCKYNAFVPLRTPETDLAKYEYTVAIPSPVLFSQFNGNTPPWDVMDILKEKGFDLVYNEANMCEMSSFVIEEYLHEHGSSKPIISSTCPAVVRLIQRLFPALCKLIIPIEPPREIAAKMLKEEISIKHNIEKSKIGIFHITPCPAKLVSINYPESLGRSFLDGAMLLNDIYGFIKPRLKKIRKIPISQTHSPISGIGLGWAIPDGEVRGSKFRTVSVSGVLDTIKILQDVEANKLKDIDYLQCLICPDGCVGGPLTVENRFIAKSNILRLVRIYGGKRTMDKRMVKEWYREGVFSFERSIEPKPFPPLDLDRKKALEKLKLKEEILLKLPGTDCGLCGSPDCVTFAEDIARHKIKKITDCIYFKVKGEI